MNKIFGSRSGELLKPMLLALLLGLGQLAEAQEPLKVVTTTTTLGHLVERIGGAQVQVTVLGKGTQDPHYLEAKPSYMVKLREADLVVAVGLDLEVGWLPNVLRGARNPRIQVGQSGYLELGPTVEPIERLEGKVDRSEGDLHPLGNPHFHLDPLRYARAGQTLAARLAELRPAWASNFATAATGLTADLTDKEKKWSARVKATDLKEVVTYHRTLTYFLNRFGLQTVGEVESKPGVPPTAKHLMEIIKRAQEKKVSCLLHESFFEVAPSERVAKSSGMSVQVVPTEIQAVPEVGTYEALIERLILALENCRQLRSKSL